MNKETQDLIVREVKGVLPTVVEFMEKNKDKVDDFDYGFLYEEGIWEATFFNGDEAVVYVTASNDSELIKKINNYTI
tara:strand:- start:198 stop:428 length:231 start_codon:yes stop_codon:yes gene_type:complete